MRILLVIPPSEFLIDDRAFPFLGPLQIAAVARREGYEVAVCDLTGHTRHGAHRCADEACMLDASCVLLADNVQRFKPAIVGFYALYAHFPIVTKLLHYLREHAGPFMAVIGGPHANTSPEECVAAGFDYAIVADQGGGGGEPGFLKLLAQIAAGRPPRGPLPLAQTAIIKEPSRPAGMGTDRGEYVNDRWPYPARDLIDLADYQYTVAGRRFTTVVTQAGCPFNCHFCGHWGGYTKLALRSPQHVFDELWQIKRAYPWVQGIMFYDDEVNIRPDFKPFLGMLADASKGLGFKYRAFFKCGRTFMNPEVFDAMAEAGFIELCTGVEAADPHLLKMVGKGATVEDNTRFVELCSERRISMKMFTMVGHPDETQDTVRALRDWLVRMVDVARGRAPINADVTILTPTRHTPIWDKPEKFANLKFDRDLDFSRELVHYKGKPGEYRAFTSTLGLSADELVAARQWVEDEFRRAAGLAPLVAKDDG